MVYLNEPSIYDQKHFPQEIIEAANPTNVCINKCDDFLMPAVSEWTKFQDKQSDLPFDEFLKETNTTSFIVMRNDSILYENYFNGNRLEKQNIAFSITKAVITSLLAIAIEEGAIKSIEQSVGEFVEAFNVGDKKLIKIRDLLQMTSGIDHGDYRTYFKIGQTYYNSNLDDYVAKLKVAYKPSSIYEYKSIDTQVLGMVIEAATGKEVSNLIAEKIWKPLGMEFDAFFTKDRADGNERMYGGMAMSSRDILKLGMLYLKNGNWKGKQIIPKDWAKTIGMRTQRDGKWWGYNKGWWLETFIDGDFLEGQDYYASGFQGQYLYINPKENLIILRQGVNPGGIRWYTAIGYLAKLMGQNYQLDTMNIVDNPADFEGDYFSENKDKLEVRKDKKSKWTATLFSSGKKTKYEMTSHSAHALTNERKLNLIMFDVKDGKVEGLHFDRSKIAPAYFTKGVLPSSTAPSLSLPSTDK